MCQVPNLPAELAPGKRDRPQDDLGFSGQNEKAPDLSIGGIVEQQGSRFRSEGLDFGGAQRRCQGEGLVLRRNPLVLIPLELLDDLSAPGEELGLSVRLRGSAKLFLNLRALGF